MTGKRPPAGDPEISVTEIRLHPRAPFDFYRSAAIFSTGDQQIRLFRDGIFRQPLVMPGGPVLAEVRSEGTTESPDLSLRISSGRPIGSTEIQETGSRIASMLSLDDDLVPFYRGVAGDPILTSLTEQLRGVKAPVTPTVYEALTDSIIEQQISLRAARSIENRLIRMTGQQLALGGVIYYCYPEPSALARATGSMYRACGLTIRKGEYIRDISRSIVAGDLDVESFRKDDDTESIIGRMVRLRGIGRWTAELTILRGLHRPDAFPADDVGVRRFISQVYQGGTKISSADARSFAERWGPWKGFAAYYLEIADLLGIRPDPDNLSAEREKE
jgi:DNA-3-methyladenine glycosylase II